MVVFTCPHCNTSIKRNKVDEHFLRRKCPVEYVTCIDCSKDFYGDDFKQHTVCVSESAKYGAKVDGEASASSMSTSCKLSWQEQAIENLQTAMESCHDKKLCSLLEFLSTQSNLSRKKGKFINQCKNSFSICKREPNLAEEAWKIANAKPEELEPDPPMDTDTASTGSASKRPSANNSEDEEIAQVKAKKAKKQKVKEDNMERLNDTIDPADYQEAIDSSGKFNWRKNIFSIVSKKGEIGLKKLQKKMSILFAEAEQRPCHEDKFVKKLYSKLNSMANIRVDGTTVYVVEEDEAEADSEESG